jgi:hypothetical protein
MTFNYYLAFEITKALFIFTYLINLFTGQIFSISLVRWGLPPVEKHSFCGEGA